MSKKTERHKNARGPAGTTKTKEKQSGKGAWKMMDRASTIAAALVARKATTTAWRIATGKQPPSNARHPDVSNREAVAWAIVAGAGVELTKVLIRRAAATYWVRSTGKLPPGVKPLATPEGRVAQSARLALHEKPVDTSAEAPTGRRAKRAARRA